MNVISYVNNCTEFTRSIPIHLQRLMMANYCAETQIQVRFEQLEIEVMGHLPTLLHILETDRPEAVLLFSIYALPNKAKWRSEILKAALANGVAMHFANESMVVHDAKTAREVERVLAFSKLPNVLSQSS
jgi:sporadic carbohydrate cluster protein (TIGR04323 family)